MTGPEALIVYLDPKTPPDQRNSTRDAILMLKAVTGIYPIRHVEETVRLFQLLNKPAENLDLHELDAWIKEHADG